VNQISLNNIFKQEELLTSCNINFSSSGFRPMLHNALETKSIKVDLSLNRGRR